MFAIERLIGKLEEASNSGAVVNLITFSPALIADVISHYSYRVSLGCLDGHSENILTDATKAMTSFRNWLRFSPIEFSNKKKVSSYFCGEVLPQRRHASEDA